MMRHDLAFFLCCCKSFLGSSSSTNSGDSFYDLLGVERDASQEDLKRSYKRRSLEMHPDKLAQRGHTVTAADQAKFTRMKEAYEVLSDPHRRDTYDAIGERGMKWIDEPFSIDPQELAHNFATSSVLDRSKIFAIFVALAVACLVLPVLICLHVDGIFGEQGTWMATLTPLWLGNAVILFYHVRLVLMGPIQRPETIPEHDWVDPLPMRKRIVSLLRYILLVLFQILAALKLDRVLTIPWTLIFIPIYIWEATILYKKLPLARMRIVSVQDLESSMGKPFSLFTAVEKELIGKRYTVVPSTESPEFDLAQKLKIRARLDIIKSVFRLLFVVLLLFQLDGDMEWNWFIVFLPFWFTTGLICFANYQSFAEVQRMAEEKDPTLFGTRPDPPSASPGVQTDYGAVGENGVATTDEAKKQQNPPPSSLTEEEREELKAQVMASSSRLCSKCCSQGFLLLLVCLFVGKLQGAGYSSFLIISPFLLAVRCGVFQCVVYV
jgi:hypothetical protein